MFLYRLFYRIAAIILLLSAISPAQPIVHIGVVLDGPSESSMETLEKFKTEILDLTKGEFQVLFPPDNTVHGHWQVDKIRTKIQELLSGPNTDLVIALGPIASHIACLLPERPKPVIAPAIFDIELQNIPVMSGKSNVNNLSYIAVPDAFKQDIEAFLEITPFQDLAVLAHKSIFEAMDTLVPKMQRSLEAYSITVHPVEATGSIDAILAKFPNAVDAVYVFPLAHLDQTRKEDLAEGLVKKKLPSFSLWGRHDVELGFQVGLNKNALPKLARRTALNVQRILLGEQPKDIPVNISLQRQLTINRETCERIDIFPSWAVLTEAEVIRPGAGPSPRQIDLFTCIQRAQESNLDLSAKQYYVSSGRQAIHQARAKLLPSFDLSASWIFIDEYRATASLGQQAERTLSGNLTATQILFSGPLWSNLDIQKKLSKVREFEYAQQKLDVINDAATGYLNVLITSTFEKIQQENLKVTRQNLEFARVREAIGSAGPSEVYRWESEIATNRKDVILANSQRNLAEIQLNRLLHRPAEEDFDTKELGVDSPFYLIIQSALSEYIENAQRFKVFRRFMVEEALKKSPELAALDAAIEVRERLLQSANHAFWMPTVAVQASMSNKFSRRGKGSDMTGFELPPEWEGSFKIPEPKNFSWDMGVNVSFPLFMGGEKFATRHQAIFDLNQFRTERRSIAEKIEQRTRSALHTFGASNASIKQTRLAAEAAAKSLKVVQDLYQQGLVSIVELLDAQRTALVTEQVAATTLYSSMIDLINVQRAIGQYIFIEPGADLDRFTRRADRFFKQSGIELH